MTQEPVNVVNDFIDGQQACEKGLPCPIDASEDFVRGYATQYELEQIENERTRRKA